MLQQPVLGKGWNPCLSAWTGPRVSIQSIGKLLREFSCFTLEVYRNFHFAYMYFTNQSNGTTPATHSW